MQCDERRAASRAGEMFYDARIGWVYPAENRAWPKLLRDEQRPPIAWTFCPFCGGYLPDTITAIGKLLDEPDEGEGDE